MDNQLSFVPAMTTGALLIAAALAFCIVLATDLFGRKQLDWSGWLRVALSIAGLIFVAWLVTGCAEETAPVRFDVAGPADCEALVSWHDTHGRRGGVVGLPWESPEFEAPVRARPELTVWNIELCDGVNIGAQVRGTPVERQDVGIMATLRVEV